MMKDLVSFLIESNKLRLKKTKWKMYFPYFLVFILILSCAGIKVKEDFDRASQINTNQSYSQFLNENPNSKYSDQASKKLLELREKQKEIEKEDFEKAGRINTIQSYSQFLNENPNSKYSDQASKRLSELREKQKEIEKEDFEKASQINTVQAYSNFLDEHPSGDYSYRAYNRLLETVEKQNQLREELKEKEKEDFEKASQINTIQAYSNFLKEHPNGVYWHRVSIIITEIQDLESIASQIKKLKEYKVGHTTEVQFINDGWNATDPYIGKMGILGVISEKSSYRLGPSEELKGNISVKVFLGISFRTLYELKPLSSDAANIEKFDPYIKSVKNKTFDFSSSIPPSKFKIYTYSGPSTFGELKRKGIVDEKGDIDFSKLPDPGPSSSDFLVLRFQNGILVERYTEKPKYTATAVVIRGSEFTFIRLSEKFKKFK